MSREKFNDDCAGCRPVLTDPETGKIEPADSPYTKVFMKVWDDLKRKDREAFHRVTCLNSKAPHDLARVHAFTEKVRIAGDRFFKDKKE